MLRLQKLLSRSSSGEPPSFLLLGVLLIVIGIEFVSLGLIKEMLARTCHESQEEEIFVVRAMLE